MRFAALLAVLTALAGLALAAFSGLLISRAALRPEVFLSLGLLVTAVRAAGLGRAGMRYAERLRGHDAALRGSQRARGEVYAGVAALGRDALSLERSGDVLARAGADVDARQFLALRVTLPLWAFAGALLALLIWLGSLDPLLAALGTVPLLLGALAVVATGPALARLARQEQTLTREHATTLLDTLSASADGAARSVQPRLTRQAHGLTRLSERTAALGARLTLLREVLGGVAVAGVLWRGAHLVGQGELPGPLLAAAALAVLAAAELSGPLAAMPGTRAAAREALRRAAQLHATSPAVQDPAAPRPLPTPQGPGGPDLHLRNVTVRRAGRTVLRGVNLHVPSGSALGLTGESGGGKTTLARLLSRDLDPQEGQVLVGGVPLPDLRVSEWRSRLAVLEQDAPLLDGTVRENLLLGDHHAPDARLRALLDDLGLGHLPLDAWVGDGGARLSGGERARVALARTLLRRAPLLILDEPTAHLDPDTEAQVVQVIRRERRGRTLLLITHRPAPLALTDRVAGLWQGQLTFHGEEPGLTLPGIPVRPPPEPPPQPSPPAPPAVPAVPTPSPLPRPVKEPHP
ncbi:thiol reductant ABC exporter subunit CydC [Deinococcus knuensis]|uniref:Thiol reductant ABC exporter subunit CydC n=1 Tax=Deinococcus knuensis TaxID=1837380 RepID=A0ABQ2SD57_9DEIO|nr:thiol reductant ABC exporter subunit CydC [Deinococcus knuensis]GGS22066.1 thiol reductant ABC exporter subunit CydC [Deinococcus knuensis]